MNSKFHYHIDLNEDQTNQPLPLSSSPSFSSSSSSSPTSSLSYLPFFNPPIDHGGYFHGDHSRVLFQSQEEVKEIVSIGGSCDHVTHTNETRLKLTIRKKDGKIYDQDHKMSSKMMTNQRNISDKNGFNEDRRRRSSSTKDQDYNGDVYNNNKNIINGVIRVCSDCNTTKTPLWRSGPSGPKSLCNACGIRQRKARRAAAMAAAGGSGQVDNAPAVPTIKKTNKRSTKNQNGGSFHVKKKCKITAEDNSVTETKTPSSSTKLCFDDLTIILSKSSAFQKVFPQDEKEAAILLMAMSYGMVCS